MNPYYVLGRLGTQCLLVLAKLEAHISIFVWLFYLCAKVM